MSRNIFFDTLKRNHTIIPFHCWLHHEMDVYYVLVPSAQKKKSKYCISVNSLIEELSPQNVDSCFRHLQNNGEQLQTDWLKRIWNHVISIHQMHTFPLKNLFNPKVDNQEAEDSCYVSEQDLLMLNSPLADFRWGLLIELLSNRLISTDIWN